MATFQYAGVQAGKKINGVISASDPRAAAAELRKKRIIVTSFASNVARMESAFYCAEKTGRQIALVGRSMHRIYKAARQCGYLKNTIEPLDPREAKNFSREKIVYLCTGSQGEPMGAMMRIANYIHPDVFIEKGDAVIFSSKIIPGNEKKLYKLHNQLVKDGIEVISEENEFVELMNISNEIIELTGVTFTEGIRYKFNHSETLKPEERLVITPDKYEGQLDNGGERITLVDAQGEIIENFKYDDKEPWYESSDGDGPSLVRINPKSISDPNFNTSWRSSADDGGNPGTFDNTYIEGDELIKYAFTNFATQQIDIQNGYIIFNYQKNLLADDIAVIPQKSNDLQNWYNVEAFEIISQIKIDKNTSKISLKIDKGNKNDSSSMKYLRLKLNIIN